jgi:hypothetical protein
MRWASEALTERGERSRDEIPRRAAGRQGQTRSVPRRVGSVPLFFLFASFRSDLARSGCSGRSFLLIFSPPIGSEELTRKTLAGIQRKTDLIWFLWQLDPIPIDPSNDLFLANILQRSDRSDRKYVQRRTI